MERDKNTIDIVFRVYKDNGETLALFPHEVSNINGNVTCYEHTGQHGEADYGHCMSITKPATEGQYKNLKIEMENLGYVIKVVKKQNYEKFLSSYRVARGL